MLQELENWLFKHKAREVTIDHGNGYGASCWEVCLKAENGVRVVAFETAFFEYSDNNKHPKIPNGILDEVDGAVYVFVDDGDSDWPGLEKTIKTAIDTANKLLNET